MPRKLAVYPTVNSIRFEKTPINILLGSQNNESEKKLSRINQQTTHVTVVRVAIKAARLSTRTVRNPMRNKLSNPPPRMDKIKV